MHIDDETQLAQLRLQADELNACGSVWRGIMTYGSLPNAVKQTIPENHRRIVVWEAGKPDQERTVFVPTKAAKKSI